MKIKLGLVLFGLVFLLARSAASVEAQVGMMEGDIAVDEVDGNEELGGGVGGGVEKDWV